ncbi:hypothetical protein Bint_1402 [Brachyspira intermedia PWS/A]|uniref:Peptidase M30, hyicolysin n=1 Tax=Brachyspira intermedia (strain ATCC 51140 / PWS/A) TaxID=1045858 RepID=G0EPW1_BRAIP|nr:hypothetical protein [Brachyspira intermedia]AEM22021.1 hypothetical protein Bint_1402 [Brachyspira intermedia PWS/A]
MKKLLFIYLSIFTVFILSCGNKVMNPTESVDGIVYYDVNNTETAKFNISVFYEDLNKPEVLNDIEFKKVAESDNAIVYIESGQSFDMNNVKSFFNKFEENYDEEVRIYGEPISLPNINNDKLVFLIYNFFPKYPLAGGGFFNISDLYDNKKDPVLNKGKYMYIDIKFVKEVNIVFGVMLHEFQHLINVSVNRVNEKQTMNLWLNEALSESTSVLFAPAISGGRNKIFNLLPYYSFYSWYINDIIPTRSSFDAINVSYSSSSVFMEWILEKGGKEAIRAIANSDPSLETRARLVNSVKDLNIGNDIEEIFISWIKDIYYGRLNQFTVRPFDFWDDTYSNLLMDPNKGLALVPGGFIIYDANKYNLDNIQGLKKQVLDAEKNLYLVWNPKFDSVDAEGHVSENDVIWINATPK